MDEIYYRVYRRYADTNWQDSQVIFLSREEALEYIDKVKLLYTEHPNWPKPLFGITKVVNTFEEIE